MAAGDALWRTGTAIVLKDTGTPSATLYVWGIKGLASGAARVSPRIDLGADPRPGLYDVALHNQWATAPTINQVCSWYAAQWHDDAGPSLPDGLVPAADTLYANGTAGVQKFKNMMLLANVKAETAAAGPFLTSVQVPFVRRWISLMCINWGTPNLVNIDDLNFARITAAYPQIQSA